MLKSKLLWRRWSILESGLISRVRVVRLIRRGANGIVGLELVEEVNSLVDGEIGIDVYAGVLKDRIVVARLREAT